MITRSDRDSLISLIKKYTSEKIGAFDLDESLAELADKTKDETVSIVSNYLWYFYDDFEDHSIVASKEDWDLFQRFILLLKSDEELRLIEQKKYTIRQVLSAILLCIFCIAWWQFGWEFELLITSAFLGVFSIFISFWKQKEEQNNTDDISELFPFNSFQQLMRIRKKQELFQKVKYNYKLEKKRIRSPEDDALMHLRSRLLWLIYSPVVLLFQSFPEEKTQIKIVT